MARSLVASDNFNRSTGLGANWTQLNSLNWGDAQIISDTVLDGSSVGDGADGSSIVWSGAGTFSNDQYSSIVVADFSFGSENYGHGVICRASTDTHTSRDMYFFNVRTNGVAYFGKIVNGTETLFPSMPASVSFSNGDRVELECEGTTIRAMKNGVALGGLFTVTDSSIATGKPGVSACNGGAGCTGDNWEGGDLSAATGGTGGMTSGGRLMGGILTHGSLIG